jgi:hypothetical protein
MILGFSFGKIYNENYALLHYSIVHVDVCLRDVIPGEHVDAVKN